MAQVTSTTPDLMGIVSRQITPDVIRNVASQLSEDRTTTASALSAAVPSALTALSDVASSDTGARHIQEVIDEKRRDSAEGIEDDRPLLPSGSNVAVCRLRALFIELIALNVPAIGSYSSASVKETVLLPPTTSTLPSGINVDDAPYRVAPSGPVPTKAAKARTGGMSARLSNSVMNVSASAMIFFR